MKSPSSPDASAFTARVLASPGAFDQQMAVREQRDQQALHQFRLAENLLPDVLDEGPELTAHECRLCQTVCDRSRRRPFQVLSLVPVSFSCSGSACDIGAETNCSTDTGEGIPRSIRLPELAGGDTPVQRLNALEKFAGSETQQ